MEAWTRHPSPPCVSPSVRSNPPCRRPKKTAHTLWNDSLVVHRQCSSRQTALDGRRLLQAILLQQIAIRFYFPPPFRTGYFPKKILDLDGFTLFALYIFIVRALAGLYRQVVFYILFFFRAPHLRRAGKSKTTDRILQSVKFVRNCSKISLDSQ